MRLIRTGINIGIVRSKFNKIQRRKTNASLYRNADKNVNLLNLNYHQTIAFDSSTLKAYYEISHFENK